MSNGKTITRSICAALLLGGCGLACAGTAFKSCSVEDQKTFYRDLLIKDQKWRGPDANAEMQAGGDRLAAVLERARQQDAENQAQLDSIVTACGWPEDSPFFNSNLEVAFLVIQHSPRDFTERHQAKIEAAFSKSLIPSQRMDDFRRYLAWKKSQQ